jgi:hypothetical protein
MVHGAEVVAIFARNNCKLVGGVARVRVDVVGKVVVAFRRTPIALLVLLDKFGFAIAGEVTEVNQGLVAGLKDSVS